LTHGDEGNFPLVAPVFEGCPEVESCLPQVACSLWPELCSPPEGSSLCSEEAEDLLEED
jgi:hypothetical protein